MNPLWIITLGTALGFIIGRTLYELACTAFRKWQYNFLVKIDYIEPPIELTTEKKKKKKQ